MAREIVDDRDQKRYLLTVDGEHAGLIDYDVLEGGTIDILHTEIDEDKREHGLASWFVGRVLDGIRENGGTILPHCPYVRRWLEEPENAGYRDLVAR